MCLFQFAELTGLDQQPFHIVGLSMGAALAGLFAAEYPSLVKKATLSCPSSEYTITAVYVSLG